MHEGEIVSVAFFSIFIVWVIAHYCAKSFKAWQVTALKRDMVARGYTAQEIVDVVADARKSGGASPLANVPPAKQVNQPMYSS